MADLRRPPPPRWRVVERDRRLVVIDTWSGAPVRSAAPTAAPTPPAPGWLPKQLQFDGTAELTTRPFYDDKAPRTIRLDPGSAAALRHARTGIGVAAIAIAVLAILNVWFLLPLAVVLINPKVRAPIRAAITGWLDRIEREAS